MEPFDYTYSVDTVGFNSGARKYFMLKSFG